MDLTDTKFCTECGKASSADDLFTFENHHVCLECKPAFAQRLRQGGVVAQGREYAGFWIRFVARVIDSLIVAIVNVAVGALIGIGIGAGAMTHRAPGMAVQLLSGAAIAGFFVNTLIAMFYEGFFLVRNGATPGKMLLNLKVITADGGTISWGRAIGRYCCYWLDALTLTIGYIIAGFDSEKRALHDHICGTRVVRNASVDRLSRS